MVNFSGGGQPVPLYPLREEVVAEGDRLYLCTPSVKRNKKETHHLFFIYKYGYFFFFVILVQALPLPLLLPPLLLLLPPLALLRLLVP